MTAIVDVRERTELAMSVFRFGEQQGMTFKPQPYRGMLAQPFTDEEFLYRDARDMPPEFNMPLKAWRRFFAVYENYPVVQVVIAEEIEPEREWQKTIEAGKTAAKGAGIVAGAVGVGLLTILAMVPMALMADPKLIVVLDDGSWLSIAEWV